MSLRIGDALRDGFERTATRNGLVLIGVFLVFSALNTVLSQSLSLATQQYFQQFSTQAAQQTGAGSFGAAQTVLAVPLPLPAALVLTLVTMLFAEGLRIVGIRMFAPDETLPVTTDSLRDGLPVAVLNGVVAGTIATVLTYLGLVFLIIPGVFIALSLFFVRQEIALQNKNFIDALRDSWELSGGNRLELLGLGVLIFVISLLASSPATVLVFLSPIPALLLGIVANAVTTVFGIAVVTRAYQQLQGQDTAPDTGASTTETTQSEGVGL